MRTQQTVRELCEPLTDMPVPMYMTDGHGRLVLWNRALEAWSGLPASAVVGQSPGPHLSLARELVPVPGDNPLLEEVLRTGQAVSLVDCRLTMTIGGGERSIDFFGEPVRDAQDVVCAALAVVRDNTRERVLDKALDGMERTAGHDLRNAVGVLEGYLPILLSGDAIRLDETGSSICQTLLRTSRLLQSIIDLMLTNVRHARHLVAGTAEAVSLAEICHVACRNLEPTAANKDVTFAQTTADMTVRGAGDLMHAVVANVLYAATKLSRNRAVVDLRASNGGDRVMLQITFVGRPIQPADLHRMISVVGDTHDPRLGVGVSLFQAQAILALYGGNLTVVDHGSGSSSFEFSLPRSSPPGS